METTLLLARLILLVVFTVAGVAKLADLPGSRKAMRDFGVSERFVAPAAIALPLAELVIAALLIPASTAWWGALGALALLLVFVAGIAYNLAHGRRPNCHCFGQLHSQPAGRATLIRNTVLSGIALFVIVFGRGLFPFSNEDAGPNMLAWIGDLSAWELVATVLGSLAIAAIIVEGWLLLQLLRQNGRLLLRLDAVEATLRGDSAATPVASADREQEADGLPEGTEAPDFALRGIYGETATLDSLRAAGKPVLLLFVDPDCGPCNALLPEVGQWQREHAADLTVALISRGSREANRAKAEEHGIANVLLQRREEVDDAYRIEGTPDGVLIDPDGTIAAPAAAGVEEIRELVARAIGASDENAPAAQDQVDDVPEPEYVPEPVPDVELTDLTGKTVNLRSVLGSPTIILFWNPDCGFCQHMLPRLKAWETGRPANAPKLLIVSMGTPEENTAMGLTSRILLDQDFTTGDHLGADGTPTAVLIDEQGMPASDLAVGGAAVLELLGDSPDPEETIAA